MSRLLMLTCAVALSFAPAALSAPVPIDTKNSAGPTITLQVKSIDQLLATAKSTAKNFLPEEFYKEFEKNVLGKLDVDVLKGVDTKKPMGLYAVLGDGLLDGDFAKSMVVALVPVTSEKEFLGLLQRSMIPVITVEKKDDHYAIEIPDFPADLTLRFLKGYAYFVLAKDKVDVKTLLDPRDVIDDKETAAIVARLRIDRLPNDLKKRGLDSLSQAGKRSPLPDGPEKELFEEIVQAAVRALIIGVDDGKELAVRVDLDPKSGAFVFETSVEAKKDTYLARSVAGLKPTKNEFASLVGADSAAHVLVQMPLFVKEVRTLLTKLIEISARVKATDLANEPKEVQEIEAELFKALDRTVKNGRADFFASLRGPDKNDQYTAIGAFSLKDAPSAEKSIRAALKSAPKEVSDALKVDAHKVGAINVHEITVGEMLPPEAQKIFGKSSVYVAFAPNAVFVTFGAHAKDLMKEALTAKLEPRAAPLVHAEVSGKRLVPLLKAAGVPFDGPFAPILETYTKLDKLPILSIKVDGGDKLVIRTEIGALPIFGWFGVRVGGTFQEVKPLPMKGK